MSCWAEQTNTDLLGILGRRITEEIQPNHVTNRGGNGPVQDQGPASRHHSVEVDEFRGKQKLRIIRELLQDGTLNEHGAVPQQVRTKGKRLFRERGLHVLVVAREGLQMRVRLHSPFVLHHPARY